MKTIKIIDNPDIKTSELMDNLCKKFNSWCYWSNDELDKYFLPPKSKTTREFNISENPDVVNKSWNDLKDQKQEMMTFREYILFFEAYHKETGEYPDKVGWTFFRDMLPDGSVGRGDWYPDSGRVEFGWHYPQRCGSDGGARLAVSPYTLTSSSLESQIKSLENLGIKQYVDKDIVETMPTHLDIEKIELFTIGKYVSNKELMEEYENRGLTPASPYSFMKEYGENPPYDFMATVWNFKDRKISYIAFRRWYDDRRYVDVHRDRSGWRGYWWFAGVRKSSDLKPSELKNSHPSDLESRVAKLEAWKNKMTEGLLELLKNK